MNEDKVRAAFEAMCAEKNYRLSPDQNNCGIVVPERYGHPTVQRMWEAYRAAYAQARREALEEVLSLRRFGMDGFDNLEEKKNGWLIHESDVETLLNGDSDE